MLCLLILGEGTADDLDLVMKALFSDPKLVEKHRLCSINSINWSRIMSQIAHYFYAYYQVRYSHILKIILQVTKY